jgi:hypothetical protein
VRLFLLVTLWLLAGVVEVLTIQIMDVAAVARVVIAQALHP